MEAIDIKKMTCCEDIILPKINVKQKPYLAVWKCPECGDTMVQAIHGSDLLVLEIAESIDATKAFSSHDCFQ
jgi:predicted RNA-binding Zn-ribbon protein involved in translation (DUF1610 family)